MALSLFIDSALETMILRIQSAEENRKKKKEATALLVFFVSIM